MITKKKFVALILAFVTLGCWGVWSARADDLGLGYYQQGGANLDGPSYVWWYGCSPTSAGMMMGYYDRKGYGGLSYGNLVYGGVAEASTFPSTAGSWQYLAQYTIASPGNKADFYSGGYGASGDDLKTPFHSFNCLADFMGTSQDSAGNSNGSTTFYYHTSGARLYAQDIYQAGYLDSKFWNDGMLGMDEYFRYAGYGTGTLSGDTNFYTQAIKTGNMTQGFTFDDYMAEIDNGRVVMIQLDGHSVFGYGYDKNGEIVYLNDTWNEGVNFMTWGGSYSGRAEWGVVCFTPTGGSPVPLPSTLLLMISGLGGLVGLRVHFRQK